MKYTFKFLAHVSFELSYSSVGVSTFFGIQAFCQLYVLEVFTTALGRFHCLKGSFYKNRVLFVLLLKQSSIWTFSNVSNAFYVTFRALDPVLLVCSSFTG